MQTADPNASRSLGITLPHQPCKRAAIIRALLPVWAALGFAISASGVNAQDDAEPEKTWFQIEILVLTSNNPNALSGEEWPLKPNLMAPERWRLQPSEDVSKELQAVYQVETTQTPAGTFEIDWSSPTNVPWPGVDESLFQYRPSDLYDPALQSDTNRLDYRMGYSSFSSERMFVIPRDNPNRLDVMVSSEAPINATTPLPVTHVWLGEDTRTPTPELARAKQRLESSDDYEVRHYLRWAEQLQDETKTLPVRIDSASRGQAWPELQGDITVYVSRYLHIKTNLWLNTDGHYLPEWQMPEPPQPANPIQHRGLPVGGQRIAAADSELQEITPMGRPDWLLEAGIGQQFRYVERNRPDSNLPNSLADDETPYPFRHAVALQQTRRMRSGEIHYIDHPAMALIISITRIEDDNLADFKRWVLAEQVAQDQR